MGNPLAWKGLKQPGIKKDSYILATTMKIWNPFWLLYMPDAIKISSNADFEVNGHRRIIIMKLMQSVSMSEKPDGNKKGSAFLKYWHGWRFQFPFVFFLFLLVSGKCFHTLQLKSNVSRSCPENIGRYIVLPFFIFTSQIFVWKL